MGRKPLLKIIILLIWHVSAKEKIGERIMERYELLGGGFVEGNTAKEIVQRLNNASFFGAKETIEEFMEETAKACEHQNGSTIRATTAEDFVADLIENGFMVRV